jgi:hypothetical protein
MITYIQGAWIGLLLLQGCLLGCESPTQSLKSIYDREVSAGSLASIDLMAEMENAVDLAVEREDMGDSRAALMADMRVEIDVDQSHMMDFERGGDMELMDMQGTDMELMDMQGIDMELMDMQEMEMGIDMADDGLTQNEMSPWPQMPPCPRGTRPLSDACISPLSAPLWRPIYLDLLSVPPERSIAQGLQSDQHEEGHPSLCRAPWVRGAGVQCTIEGQAQLPPITIGTWMNARQRIGRIDSSLQLNIPSLSAWSVDLTVEVTQAESPQLERGQAFAYIGFIFEGEVPVPGYPGEATGLYLVPEAAPRFYYQGRGALPVSVTPVMLSRPVHFTVSAYRGEVWISRDGARVSRILIPRMNGAPLSTTPINDLESALQAIRISCVHCEATIAVHQVIGALDEPEPPPGASCDNLILNPTFERREYSTPHHWSLSPAISLEADVERWRHALGESGARIREGDGHLALHIAPEITAEYPMSFPAESCDGQLLLELMNVDGPLEVNVTSLTSQSCSSVVDDQGVMVTPSCSLEPLGSDRYRVVGCPAGDASLSLTSAPLPSQSPLTLASLTGLSLSLTDEGESPDEPCVHPLDEERAPSIPQLDALFPSTRLYTLSSEPEAASLELAELPLILTPTLSAEFDPSDIEDLSPSSPVRTQLGSLNIEHTEEALLIDARFTWPLSLRSDQLSSFIQSLDRDDEEGSGGESTGGAMGGDGEDSLDAHSIEILIETMNAYGLWHLSYKSNARSPQSKVTLTPSMNPLHAPPWDVDLTACALVQGEESDELLPEITCRLQATLLWSERAPDLSDHITRLRLLFRTPWGDLINPEINLLAPDQESTRALRLLGGPPAPVPRLGERLSRPERAPSSRSRWALAPVIPMRRDQDYVNAHTWTLIRDLGYGGLSVGNPHVNWLPGAIDDAIASGARLLDLNLFFGVNFWRDAEIDAFYLMWAQHLHDALTPLPPEGEEDAETQGDLWVMLTLMDEPLVHPLSRCVSDLTQSLSEEGLKAPLATAVIDECGQLPCVHSAAHSACRQAFPSLIVDLAHEVNQTLGEAKGLVNVGLNLTGDQGLTTLPALADHVETLMSAQLDQSPPLDHLSFTNNWVGFTPPLRWSDAWVTQSIMSVHGDREAFEGDLLGVPSALTTPWEPAGYGLFSGPKERWRVQQSPSPISARGMALWLLSHGVKSQRLFVWPPNGLDLALALGDLDQTVSEDLTLTTGDRISPLLTSHPDLRAALFILGDEVRVLVVNQGDTPMIGAVDLSVLEVAQAEGGLNRTLTTAPGLITPSIPPVHDFPQRVFEDGGESDTVTDDWRRGEGILMRSAPQHLPLLRGAWSAWSGQVYTLTLTP